MSIEFTLFCDLCYDTIAVTRDYTEMRTVVMRSPVVKQRQIVYAGTDETIAGNKIDRCLKCFGEGRTEKK